MLENLQVQYAYSGYIEDLKWLAELYRQDKMNTSLALRLAYYVRTDAVYPPDAVNLLAEIKASLGLGTVTSVAA